MKSTVLLILVYINELLSQPLIEKYHNFLLYTTPITPYVNGSNDKVPGVDESPDFRLPEGPWLAYAPNFYKEWYRPYRISPFWLQTAKFNKYIIYEFVYALGCYCCTVFKRLTPLSTCAVITTRHVLTTATATEIVLRRYKTKKTLENILGLWYDGNIDGNNSSFYMTPARIHYHPWYQRPDRTNRSHPLPCVHDLSVWASTYRFLGNPNDNSMPRALMCIRGGSTFHEKASPLPVYNDMLHIVGFQFAWNWSRRPTPFHKYLVRVRAKDLPPYICPKIEWGWFFCLKGLQWSPLGLDSGGIMHATYEGYGYRKDGLIGMNSFSMKLRSIDIMHYFTIIDTHPNIDYFYAAYMGRLPYEYLDYRFYDTQYRAPIVKPWHYIEWSWTFPVDYGWEPPFH